MHFIQRLNADSISFGKQALVNYEDQIISTQFGTNGNHKVYIYGENLAKHIRKGFVCIHINPTVKNASLDRKIDQMAELVSTFMRQNFGNILVCIYVKIFINGQYEVLESKFNLTAKEHSLNMARLHL